MNTDGTQKTQAEIAQEAGTIGGMFMSLSWESKVEITPTGLKSLIGQGIDSGLGLTQDERVSLSTHVSEVLDSMRWVAADLAADAENSVRHGDHQEHYGKVIGSLPVEFSRSARTIENWAITARAWTYKERSELLSFHHHTALNPCSREERVELIKLALERKLSVSKLYELRTSMYPAYTNRRTGTDKESADASEQSAQVEAEALRQKVYRLEIENNTLKSKIDGDSGGSSYNPNNDGGYDAGADDTGNDSGIDGTQSYSGGNTSFDSGLSFGIPTSGKANLGLLNEFSEYEYDEPDTIKKEALRAVVLYLGMVNAPSLVVRALKTLVGLR